MYAYVLKNFSICNGAKTNTTSIFISNSSLELEIIWEREVEKKLMGNGQWEVFKNVRGHKQENDVKKIYARRGDTPTTSTPIYSISLKIMELKVREGYKKIL